MLRISKKTQSFSIELGWFEKSINMILKGKKGSLSIMIEMNIHVSAKFVNRLTDEKEKHIMCPKDFICSHSLRL